MARAPTQEEIFQALLDHFGPEIASAYLESVYRLRSEINLADLVAAIEQNNIEGALEALQLDPVVFNPFQDEVQLAFNAGGRAAEEAFPKKDNEGNQLVIRFDGRNLRAERWLKDNSSSLISNVIDDQREGIRAILVDGMSKGVNPKTLGLQIVGTIDPETGLRSNGVIGLTSQQMSFVQNARNELSSSDPSLLKHYLTRTLRDKRFDASIEDAIESKTSVPASVQRKALDQYSNRLLRLRGETIGRTEALTSLHAGQQESIKQAVESGAVNQNQVRRRWDTAEDEKVRPSHASLDGDVVGIDEYFHSDSGADLLYPGDPAAPASERINCRCNVTIRIDWLANIS